MKKPTTQDFQQIGRTILNVLQATRTSSGLVSVCGPTPLAIVAKKASQEAAETFSASLEQRQTGKLLARIGSPLRQGLGNCPSTAPYVRQTVKLLLMNTEAGKAASAEAAKVNKARKDLAKDVRQADLRLARRLSAKGLKPVVHSRPETAEWVYGSPDEAVSNRGADKYATLAVVRKYITGPNPLWQSVRQVTGTSTKNLRRDQYPIGWPKMSKHHDPATCEQYTPAACEMI